VHGSWKVNDEDDGHGDEAADTHAKARPREQS
jgi:hypothetical protein